MVSAIVPIVKVSDIRESENFYCSVLGFAKDWEFALTPDGPWYVSLTLGGCFLHLSSFPGDGHGGAAVYFSVDEVDGLYNSFKQAGLEKAELEPTDQAWGRRELYVRDPDGNCLRFGAPPADAG